MFALAFVATVLVQGGLVGALTATRLLMPETEEQEPLVFFEVETPEPEPEVVEEPEPEPEPEPEVVQEPEPEVVEQPEPEPEVVEAPEPEVVDAPEPEPETAPEPVPEPESEPLPPEEVRPINVNLQGESFTDGTGGPVFNRGDTIRGGRPDRESVRADDTRTAVDQPTPGVRDGTGTAPAAAPEEPRRRRRDRAVAFRAGVSLNDADFPSGARDAGAESVCSYTLEIDATGAIDAIVAVSCSNTAFDFAGALEQFLRERLPDRPFRPAIENGVETATRLSGRHYFEVRN